MTPEFLEIINQYSWPENVKELSTAMESAVVSAQNEPTMYSIHLPSYIKTKVMKTSKGFKLEAQRLEGLQSHDMGTTPHGVAAGNQNVRVPQLDIGMPALKTAMENAEKAYLEKLMTRTSHDISEACRIAGISKSSMYKRLKKFNL